MKTPEKMNRLKEELKRQNINVSEDALFIVTEIRDSRNILLTVFGILLGIVIGLIIGFGIAILT